MLTLLRPWKSLNTLTPKAPFKASCKVLACVCSSFLLSTISTVEGVSLTVIAVLVAVTTMVSKENSCKFSSAANAVPPQSTLPVNRVVRTNLERSFFCILIPLLKIYTNHSYDRLKFGKVRHRQNQSFLHMFIQICVFFCIIICFRNYYCLQVYHLKTNESRKV